LTIEPTPDQGATPWDAADYARHSSLQEAMAAEVLALLPLAGNESVLDVGCGDGRLTARIAERLRQGHIVGVDASPDMVAFATRTFVNSATGAQTNLAFRVADARSLGYVDAFDLIVSFNALHWVPEQDRALAGITAALHAAGRAILRLVVKGEHTSLEMVAEDVRQEAQWRSYFEGFVDPYLRLTASEYAELASRHGLQVQNQQTRYLSWDFGSDAAFFGFCRAGFGAWTRRLPTSLGDEFVRAVIGAYRIALGLTQAQANVFRFYQMDIALRR